MQPQGAISRHHKIGIVLLNMGGPKTLDDVRPFLYNLFADPEIINLPRFLKPFQKQLAWIISKARAPKTRNMYQQIGNGSPILQITEQFGTMLINDFRADYPEIISTVAMRYTSPFAMDAVEVLEAANVDTVVLFSQYPHHADCTTGSSFRDFYDALAGSNYDPAEIIEIEEWGMEPEYINWWTNHIHEIFEKLDRPLTSDVHLIFSAHGLPQRYIDAGETYATRIKETAETIINSLPPEAKNITSHVSFQSQAGPVEWTRPYTDETIDYIAEIGGKTIIIVPLGFVSNHIETLYEIDILYREQAKKLGIDTYHRVPVPDSHPEYTKEIKNMVARRLVEASA